MSGRQIYYLMHKNDVVTMIEIDEVSGSMVIKDNVCLFP